MQVTVLANPTSNHQNAHQRAMAEGLKKIGIQAVCRNTNPCTDVIAMWGWRRGKAYREAGHKVLVMERGYLGDRFSWTSLGWNGLNGKATFPRTPDDPSRFTKNFKLKPWKHDGDYVLLLGQVPGDQSLEGKNLYPWYEQVALNAQTAYEMPVVFRPHPLAARRGGKSRIRNAESSTRSLEEDLSQAFVTVTWNSNSSVDSVLAGVPCVTLDKGSMAWDVTSHRIGDISRPDRIQWATDLAWKQWRIEEIASGEALKYLFQSDKIRESGPFKTQELVSVDG